jgi:NADH pyrophosphatase NudC (nudix superfamily)
VVLPQLAWLRPFDETGQMLLVRHAGHNDGWGTLGGAVEPGESPAAAAVREAREESCVDVQVAYVTAIYEARIVGGCPVVSDGELSELAWFGSRELLGLELSRFARALLSATGHL